MITVIHHGSSSWNLGFGNDGPPVKPAQKQQVYVVIGFHQSLKNFPVLQ